MPVVMELGWGKIRVHIYPDDHGAAHVHVTAPDAKAKIRLDGAIITYDGFDRATLKLIVAAILSNREHLQEVWDEYRKA